MENSSHKSQHMSGKTKVRFLSYQQIINYQQTLLLYRNSQLKCISMELWTGKIGDYQMLVIKYIKC